MASVRPQDKQPEAVADVRRDQMLAAAAHLIAERGFSDTRIADVAKRVGASPALVIYYFGTKDSLLTEALRWSEKSFYAAVEDMLHATPELRRRLESLLEMCLPEVNAEYDPAKPIAAMITAPATTTPISIRCVRVSCIAATRDPLPSSPISRSGTDRAPGRGSRSWQPSPWAPCGSGRPANAASPSFPKPSPFCAGPAWKSSSRYALMGSSPVSRPASVSSISAASCAATRAARWKSCHC